ncbi:class I SAM-dependent methyltransferase, partial [Desulfovibrio sp.]|uniref:methyltransferase domain-containing protein n=1 Tax=Desulfovibrio sp. TaxID=885 RepID=UPI0023D05945
MKAGEKQFRLLEEELLRLALPPLEEKSFLELGCAEGFYCGFAWFEGAREILGVDVDENALAAARARFPQCSFSGFAGNLARILARRGGFDVILCSSLPPGMDVAAVLPLLMSGLARKGTLVLKTAMAEAAGPGTLVEAAHHPQAMLPAEPGLASALEAYVYKDMGESVFPDAHGGKKHILHVRNKSPYAILLMGD